jgi:methionyl aminopeptidase
VFISVFICAERQSIFKCNCNIVFYYHVCRLFHPAPSVPHYAKNKAIGVMKPGHTFTIEPMISEGTWKDVTWPDNWTAVTADGKRSAQFEHTLLVTETGCDILTVRPDCDGKPHFMTQF